MFFSQSSSCRSGINRHIYTSLHFQYH